MTQPETPDVSQMSLGDHLDELRARLIRALIAVAIGLAVCLVFGMHIVKFLSQPVFSAMAAAGFDDPKMLARQLHEPFVAYIRVSLISGFVLASPYVLWEFWQFVAVGLYKHERRYVKIFAPVTVALFLAGTAFAYFLAVRVGLQFLAGFAVKLNEMGMSIDFKPVIDDSLNLIIGFSVIMGLVFQLPIVVIFLSILGIVEVNGLKKFRRYFILLAFIVGAVLTPPDPVTQIMMALPLVVLYEVGLRVAVLIERRHTRKLAG